MRSGAPNCAGPALNALYASSGSGPSISASTRRRIGHRQREDRDAVEAAARGHDAAGADAARRRLQADDVVEAGRHAARAGGVGAERERDVAACDRDRRARARAAADAIGRERAARPAVRRARADEAGRELVEVGLAEADRAGLDQLRNRCRVAARQVGERRARRGGREAGDVDVVLDRERHAEQRQRREHGRAIGERGGTRLERIDLGLDLRRAGAGDPDDVGARRRADAAVPRAARVAMRRRRTPRSSRPPWRARQRPCDSSVRVLVYQRVHRTIHANRLRHFCGYSDDVLQLVWPRPRDERRPCRIVRDRTRPGSRAPCSRSRSCSCSRTRSR